MVNFRLPYFATNIGEFWTRWHISLSSWLRDYVYIPLGGNQRHRDRNLFLTLLLGGLWHGAGLTYVLWGAYHGAHVVLHRHLRPLIQRLAPTGGAARRAWTLLVCRRELPDRDARLAALPRALDRALRAAVPRALHESGARARARLVPALRAALRAAASDPDRTVVERRSRAGRALALPAARARVRGASRPVSCSSARTSVSPSSTSSSRRWPWAALLAAALLLAADAAVLGPWGAWGWLAARDPEQRALARLELKRVREAPPGEPRAFVVGTSRVQEGFDVELARRRAARRGDRQARAASLRALRDPSARGRSRGGARRRRRDPALGVRYAPPAAPRAGSGSGHREPRRARRSAARDGAGLRRRAAHRALSAAWPARRSTPIATGRS